MFHSTKRYGHELGLSCCFRQHRADSHCNMLHGYALAFTFTFGAEKLDERGWVMDFGGLKPLKEKLVQMFDHTVVVAADDPEATFFRRLHDAKIADVRFIDRTGCESFARLAGDMATEVLYFGGHMPRVQLISVECAEHGANSATWLEERHYELIERGIERRKVEGQVT